MALTSYLVLEDGTVLPGRGFGAEKNVYGEVVFTTAMVGYPESMTDPSYRGQILVLTYPLIGNYGVPDGELGEYGLPLHFESHRIQIRALVISKLMGPSHWSSKMSLDEWMKMEGVPGIEGIDTRALVKKIRERGVMMGALIQEEEEIEIAIEKLKKIRYDDMSFLDEVSPRFMWIHPARKKERRIVVLDCGIKYGILRELLKRNFEVLRIPCREDPVRAVEEFRAHGVLLSNGPGNPAILRDLIEKAVQLIEYGIPTMGICLGEQLLALADGAEIYKLKYGHRGINKPVKDVLSGRVFVTTQNHGYAIKKDSLNEFRVWMVNMDDGTVEGIYHPRKPIIATQFHPEGSPGPWDSLWVFDKFKKLTGGGAL